MTATLEELERRVQVLEVKQRENTETLNWAAATLGKVSGVQDTHTKDLAELKATVGELKTTVGGVAAKLDALTNNLPRMMAETMRQVLAEQRKTEGK